MIRRVYPSKTIPASGEVWDVVFTYDNYGNVTSELWRNDQGMPVLNVYGYASAEGDFDMFGRAVEKRWYDAAGTLIDHESYVYDRQGRNTQVIFYDTDGSVQQVDDNAYDEFGNCIQRSYVDGDGQPCMTAEGYAAIRFGYDVFGNKADYWTYDETGALCGNVFHRTYTYSVTGKLLTETWYDAEEQLSRRFVRIYDICDRLVEAQVYDAENAYMGGSRYIYNSYGELSETIYCAEDGSQFDAITSVVMIGEVDENTLAEEAGLQVDDIIIVYNRWSFRSMLVNPATSLRYLDEELQGGPAIERHVVVGRCNEDVTAMTFIEVMFPAGEESGVQTEVADIYTSDVKGVVCVWQNKSCAKGHRMNKL